MHAWQHEVAQLARQRLLRLAAAAATTIVGRLTIAITDDARSSARLARHRLLLLLLHRLGLEARGQRQLLPVPALHLGHR